MLGDLLTLPSDVGGAAGVYSLDALTGSFADVGRTHPRLPQHRRLRVVGLLRGEAPKRAGRKLHGLGRFTLRSSAALFLSRLLLGAIREARLDSRRRDLDPASQGKEHQPCIVTAQVVRALWQMETMVLAGEGTCQRFQGTAGHGTAPQRQEWSVSLSHIFPTGWIFPNDNML